MKKLTLMMVMLLGLGLLAGCGGGEAEQAEQAAPATEAAADVQVATHDCDGGCGMTAVPVDKMTVVDGKYYCAGCAAKLETEDQAHDHTEGDDHSH